jgi:hypothetical protein
MSISNDAGHFFQTTDALETTERKSAKAKNKHGNPIKLTSKVLAAGSHDWDGSDDKIYVAEAAGGIKAVNVEVCNAINLRFKIFPLTSLAA